MASATGVTVPLPDERGPVTDALISPVPKSGFDQAVSGTMATTSSAGSALITATTIKAMASAV